MTTRFRPETHGRELWEYLDAIAGSGGGGIEYGPVAKSDELRYTFGPMYAPGVLDAHREFATNSDLFAAKVDFMKRGDRTLRLQHGPRKAGDIVDFAAWPFEHEAELRQPDGRVRKVRFPANTVYAGVVWTPDAWDAVKRGKITGLSMGGAAVKIRGLPADGLGRLR